MKTWFLLALAVALVVVPLSCTLLTVEDEAEYKEFGNSLVEYAEKSGKTIAELKADLEKLEKGELTFDDLKGSFENSVGLAENTNETIEKIGEKFKEFAGKGYSKAEAFLYLIVSMFGGGGLARFFHGNFGHGIVAKLKALNLAPPPPT